MILACLQSGLAAPCVRGGLVFLVVLTGCAASPSRPQSTERLPKAGTLRIEAQGHDHAHEDCEVRVEAETEPASRPGPGFATLRVFKGGSAISSKMRLGVRGRLVGAGVFDLASVPGLVRSGSESAVFIQLDSLASPLSRLIYAIGREGKAVLIRAEGRGGGLSIPRPDLLGLATREWAERELLSALRSASETRALEALCWISLQGAAQSELVMQVVEELQGHPDRWISEAATYAWDREAPKRGRTR